jgi:hypothetical protein
MLLTVKAELWGYNTDVRVEKGYQEFVYALPSSRNVSTLAVASVSFREL